jgi:hypothetical protein
MKSMKAASLLLAALAVLAVPALRSHGSVFSDFGAPPFPPPHLVADFGAPPFPPPHIVSVS